MISIKQIDKQDIDLCYELDSNTISVWNKNQWANEFKKEGIKVFGLLLSNLVIGICVFQVVLDEAQINYFVVNKKFRKRGFGSYFMSYIIKRCEKLNLKKILLEVSQGNVTAKRFASDKPKTFIPSFLNSLAHCFLLHNEMVFESNS